jgi:O-antigen/teichoic acid export membrane protein
MNIYYVFAILVNRLFGILTIVALSYLLKPSDFGIFAIIATNALLTHILFSSWISNSSWKDVSSLQGVDQELRISNSLRYASMLSIVPLSAALVLFIIDGEQFDYVAVTLVLVVVILFYELVLVINNARGQSRDYGAITFLRSSLTLGLSVSLIYLGFGLWGAVWGQIAGTALTVVGRPSFWKMWSNMRLRHIPWNEIAPQLKFGLISAFALNLYLMGSALCRNFVLLWLGEAEAGYFSLSADIFYAPVALFAMALSLSIIPDLYRSAIDNSGQAQAPDFITGILAVSIPYALAGIFVGPSIAPVFLGSGVSQHISEIASHSIIHAACFCVLSTQTTIALTQGRLKIAVGVPVVTLTVLAGALLGASFVLGPDGISLLRYAEAVTIGLLAITILVLLFSRPLLQVSILWGECLRISGASIAMCLVLAAVERSPLPFAPFPAILFGGATFVGAAWLLRSRIVRNLMRMTTA